MSWENEKLNKKKEHKYGLQNKKKLSEEGKRLHIKVVQKKWCVCTCEEEIMK